ncbi:MAG: CBS domain-containing protein [Trueperaceae bacterium]|nr:CBS domain-containing protein [Trueperaceae bacterium]
MLVRDWMTKDPHTVPPSTPVMEAMQLLREAGYRRLPVVKDGKLLGIVTDRDLKEATPSKATSLSIYELNYLLSKLTLKDVMRTPVVTIGPDEAIEQAALTMEEHRVSGLPVVDKGAIVGILTITDLLRAFVDFLGLREGGRRVTVDMPDAPGSLARAAAAAPPSNVEAIVTAGAADGRRHLVFRVAGEGADGFADRLEALGIIVVDVR